MSSEKITPIDKDEASNSDVSAADKNSYLSEIEKVSAPAEPEPMEDADDMVCNNLLSIVQQTLIILIVLLKHTFLLAYTHK